MGVENVIMECMFREVMDVIMNRESIIPSRHSRVDIICDRKITVPRKENKKASTTLRTVVTMMVIMVIP